MICQFRLNRVLIIIELRILLDLILPNCFIEDLNCTFATVIVFFLIEQGQREYKETKCNLRQTSKHFRQHLNLVGVCCEVRLSILAERDCDIGLVIVWVHNGRCNLAAQNCIQTEAHEDDSCYQVSLRRKITPSTKQRDKVNYAKPNATHNGVNQEETSEAFWELGTKHCTDPNHASQTNLHSWAHAVHQFVTNLHCNRADCENCWKDNDCELKT